MNGIKTYCINLQKRKDRRECMNWEFLTNEICAEYIDAVNHFDVDNYAPLSNKEEMACLLSHIKTIEKAINDDVHALILEDDVSLSFEFKKKLQDLIEYAEDYDVIHLGHYDNLGINNQEYLYSMNTEEGTFAYLVHKDFLPILLEKYKELDMACDKKLGTLHGKYNIFGTYPHLASTKEDYSDIRKRVVKSSIIKNK